MVEIRNFKTKISQDDSVIRFGYCDNQPESIRPISGIKIQADEDVCLSVSQFAKEARVTPQAVRKMISERRLNAKKVGEQYIIEKEELGRYLENK